MAGKKRKSRKKSRGQDPHAQWQAVDIYYLPPDQAKLYRGLRQAVQEEVSQWLVQQGFQVDIMADPDLGECLTAGDGQFTYPLTPANISRAQLARDQGQMEAYLRTYFARQGQVKVDPKYKS